MIRLHRPFTIACLAVGLVGATATAALAAPWYVVIDIAETLDAETYAKAVAATEPKASQAFGGTFVMRATKAVGLDGGAAPNRFVVIRFDGEAQARAWKDSAPVRDLLAVRMRTTKSRSFLVEGLAD